MGLPARQRRVLDKTEAALRGSDPTLAALYSMFARLNANEEMPKFEQLRRSVRLVFGSVCSGFLHLFARSFGRLAPRQRAAVVLPLAFAMTVTAVVFAVRLSPGPRCAPVTMTANGANNSASSNLCQMPGPTSIGK